jgi:hypothetical protein
MVWLSACLLEQCALAHLTHTFEGHPQLLQLRLQLLHLLCELGSLSLPLLALGSNAMLLRARLIVLSTQPGNRVRLVLLQHLLCSNLDICDFLLVSPFGSCQLALEILPQHFSQLPHLCHHLFSVGALCFLTLASDTCLRAFQSRMSSMRAK